MTYYAVFHVDNRKIKSSGKLLFGGMGYCVVVDTLVA